MRISGNPLRERRGANHLTWYCFGSDSNFSMKFPTKFYTTFFAFPLNFQVLISEVMLYPGIKSSFFRRTIYGRNVHTLCCNRRRIINLQRYWHFELDLCYQWKNRPLFLQRIIWWAALFWFNSIKVTPFFHLMLISIVIRQQYIS